MAGEDQRRTVDSAGAAELLGVKRVTVAAYVWRGTLPPPDGRDGRHPWWYVDTILDWKADSAVRRRRTPGPQAD